MGIQTKRSMRSVSGSWVGVCGLRLMQARRQDGKKIRYLGVLFLSVCFSLSQNRTVYSSIYSD